jgi:hypothetical protein
VGAKWGQRAARALAVTLACAALTVAAPAGEAGPWSRAYVKGLPDDAFAVVAIRPNGTLTRHLPHHDGEGRVDLPHLRNALSRLRQVHGLDPATAEGAHQHLLQHLRELR